MGLAIPSKDIVKIGKAIGLATRLEGGHITRSLLACNKRTSLALADEAIIGT